MNCADMTPHKTVPAYIAAADADKRAVLKEVRALVRATAPQAKEAIAYGMPGYKWHEKPLVYFAAMKGHLGLYPTPGPLRTCAALLGSFSTSKGCLRIPYGTKLPKALIARLLKERMKEIRALTS